MRELSDVLDADKFREYQTELMFLMKLIQRQTMRIEFRGADGSGDITDIGIMPYVHSNPRAEKFNPKIKRACEIARALADYMFDYLITTS
jgi:hypothetical protein